MLRLVLRVVFLSVYVGAVIYTVCWIPAFVRAVKLHGIGHSIVLRGAVALMVLISGAVVLGVAIVSVAKQEKAASKRRLTLPHE
jgi:hypothetical protein